MVRAAGDRALDMHRLDRRLALVAAEHARARGDGQLPLGLDDQVARPQPRVLAVERHEAAVGAAPCGAARLRSTASAPAGRAPPARRAAAPRAGGRGTAPLRPGRARRCPRRAPRPSSCRRRRRSREHVLQPLGHVLGRRAVRSAAPASLIFALARTSRWPIVAGATRNAAPICAASRPSTVCSISGVRTAASMAGWAQTNSSFRRSSGTAGASGAASSCSSARSAAAASTTPGAGACCAGGCAPRSAARHRGLAGTPSTGQVRSAATKASDSASSEAAMSRERAASIASSRP